MSYAGLLLIFSMYAVTSHAFILKVLASSYDENPTHQYHLDLLRFALDKAGTKYHEIVIIKEKITTHEQMLVLVKKRLIDVTWFGTKRYFERELHAIPIPLLQGLLGLRVSIIHKERQQQFDRLSVEELKSLTACQGVDWLDSDILEANGFKVLRVERFDLIYKMLEHGRCDYFPRAIFEGYGELVNASKKYPDLVLVDHLLLQYKFPLYFFVHKENTELANRLTLGLERAITDGSFRAFIENHPLTKHVFPLSKWREKQVFMLDNPYLPATAPVDNSALWIEL